MTKEQMKEIIVNNSYETETGIKSKIVGIEQNLELVEKVCEIEGWESWFDSFDGDYITITIE